MTKQLGGAYEPKNLPLKISTLEGRSIFFELIWKRQPDVVFDLLRLVNVEDLPKQKEQLKKAFDSIHRDFLSHIAPEKYVSPDSSTSNTNAKAAHTPLLSYFDWIYKKQNLLDDSINNSSPKLSTDGALKELVPNWSDLQKEDEANLLCSILNQWSRNWNLTDTWCLDFALDVLRNYKTKIVDDLLLKKDDEKILSEFAVSEFRYLHSSGIAWKSAVEDLRLKAIGASYDYSFIADYPSFEYKWNGIKAEGCWYIYLQQTKEDFQLEMEQQFWSKFIDNYGGNTDFLVGKMSEISNELSNFLKAIKDYTKRIEDNYSDEAVKTPKKLDGKLHFEWTVDYQVLTAKTFTKLAQENLVDRKAIESAIKSVCKIIELTLKRSQTIGRPKGKKDSYKRRRVV